MSGFFDIPQTKNNKRGQTCVSCGLYAKVRSPRMEPFGKFEKRILVIGENPGEVEDLRNKPWQGKVGQTLQRAFTKLGFDLFRDCLNTNSTQCRCTNSEGNNRTPTANEIACCRSRVLSQIREAKPHIIILLGGCAVESVIGYRWQGDNDTDSITRWRGWQIPDREFHAFICPTFHPSFVDRSEKEVETIWMQDLENALRLVDKKFPEFEEETKQVEIVEDLSFLSTVKGATAFDYEATGLKPHNTTVHRIKCMSVCNQEDKAYAFMIPEDRRQLQHIKRFLVSDVPKIASNLKYEHSWSQNILNVEVKNWVWDTMLASHVLDNRPHITGLKFQAFIRFGQVGYDSDVSAYLKSDDKKNANSVNRIEELCKTEQGRRKLMIYCGIDSLLERRLALVQMQELKFDYDKIQ